MDDWFIQRVKMCRFCAYSLVRKIPSQLTFKINNMISKNTNKQHINKKQHTEQLRIALHLHS